MYRLPPTSPAIRATKVSLLPLPKGQEEHPLLFPRSLPSAYQAHGTAVRWLMQKHEQGQQEVSRDVGEQAEEIHAGSFVSW
jgi:hypothetical protein